MPAWRAFSLNAGYRNAAWRAFRFSCWYNCLCVRKHPFIFLKSSSISSCKKLLLIGSTLNDIAAKTSAFLDLRILEAEGWCRFQLLSWYFSPYLVCFLYLVIKYFVLFASCSFSIAAFPYTLSGKFGALFASIPLPIFAAIYCILLGIVGEWLLVLCIRYRVVYLI